MQTEKLGLEHEDLLHQKLRNISVPLSEYTFPNLYLFRKNHEYEVMLDKEVFILGRSYDGHVFLMPTADVRTLDIGYLKELMRDVDFLFPIPEEWVPAFSADEFEITFAEGDADYLYTVQKMSTFAGRRLHKKRNLLKQFIEAHAHDAKPLTNNRLSDARFILKEWLAMTNMNEDETDHAACLEALGLYEELMLCGGIYYADSEPAGFVLGEELNEETFVLHFAKARTKFKGVYQYMFNNFAKILPPKYKYLNLEQDLNRENLRIFKSSYVPDLMRKKARVRLKN
ncbi:MAG TPA: phosphatidylglycerol lysyltransferase domain-containing protein [Nitrospirota bacterium]|nr:phosphatidylglycerol lysyltransferase domain-containing protein [Nitrospirota bacterium]